MLRRETRSMVDSKNECEVMIADSVSEMTEETMQARQLTNRTTGKQAIYDDSDLRGRSAWYGRSFQSHAEVQEASTKSWKEGAELVNGMLKSLDKHDVPRPTSRKRRPRWDEYDGDEFDNDRMRSGQPCWRRAQRKTVVSQGTITIVCDVRAAGGVSHERILWRGAAAVLLTKLLEDAGYRVQLWVAQAERSSHMKSNGKMADMFIAAKVKDHNQPLNMETAIAAMSAWWYRIVGFQAAHIADNEAQAATDFCGYDRTNGVRPFLDDMSKDAKRFIVDNIWDEHAAVRAVKSALEAVEKNKNYVGEWSYSPWNK